MLQFFSNDNNLDQYLKVNRRNNRWFCTNPIEVPMIMLKKTLSGDPEHVMPHHFFSKSLMVDATATEVLDSG